MTATKNPTAHMGIRAEVVEARKAGTPTTAYCGFTAVPRPFDLNKPIELCRRCTALARKRETDLERGAV
jgi:hypothetical protein